MEPKDSPRTLEDMVSLLKELTEISLEATAQSTTSNDAILSQIISFFNEDDWSFTKLQGESTLRLTLQGKTDEWTCYAKAKEDQQQFVFYSICPIAALEDKRPAIAEFITRVNYGMTIGNFELDFNDGEIRYKTSIDVEGDRLTPALVQSLVYANVTMMDAYLPGIQAVIHEGVSPIEAIRSIEQVDQTPI